MWLFRTLGLLFFPWNACGSVDLNENKSSKSKTASKSIPSELTSHCSAKEIQDELIFDFEPSVAAEQASLASIGLSAAQKIDSMLYTDDSYLLEVSSHQNGNVLNGFSCGS